MIRTKSVNTVSAGDEIGFQLQQEGRVPFGWGAYWRGERRASENPFFAINDEPVECFPLYAAAPASVAANRPAEKMICRFPQCECLILQAASTIATLTAQLAAAEAKVAVAAEANRKLHRRCQQAERLHDMAIGDFQTWLRVLHTRDRRRDRCLFRWAVERLQRRGEALHTLTQEPSNAE